MEKTLELDVPNEYTNIFKPINLNIDTICLGGGGTSGLSYIGCLEILESTNWFKLNKVNTFISTSVGSLLSFFYIIGYTNNQIKDFLMMFNLSKIEPKANCINLINNFGLDNGNKIIEVGKSFLSEKFNKREITFRELYDLTNKNLRIIVTNYTKSRTEIFDYITNPDVSVFLAIRMSMSLPFIFTPINFNNNVYIDGGLLKNFGIEYCNPETSIGITSWNRTENKIENLIEYVTGLCQIFFTSANKEIKRHKYNYIKVNSAINDSVNFSLDSDRKYQLIMKGKESANKFLDYLEVKNTLDNIIDKIN